MSYEYYLHVIATDGAAGNQLAALVGPEPGDATAFDRGVPLYAPGTTFEHSDNPLESAIARDALGNNVVPAARYVGVSCVQAIHGLASEFAGSGPYPQLNDMGLSEEHIAALRQFVTVLTGTRETTEPQWQQFISDQGWITP